MKIVDANVLLYAVNESAPHHDSARTWLDRALDGAETLAFSWVVLLAFVRLSTKSGPFPSPLAVDDALDQVRDWLASPSATVLEPGRKHLDGLSTLLGDLGTGGNLTDDAHLAALALEHRAEVIMFDNDLGRFTGVVWSPPPAP